MADSTTPTAQSSAALNGVSSATLQGLANKSAAANTNVAQGYDQFLTLLTTQLKNQDPLDPMDSSQFTDQLVQFSQVEQAIISNQKMDALLQVQNNSLLSNSLQYIGKDIYYKGDSVYMNGSSVRVGYTLDSAPTVGATMRFEDANGATVRTYGLGTDTTSNIVWDGKDDNGNTVAAGVYKVVVDALDSSNNPITSYTGVPAHVLGVETSGGAVKLSLDGDRQMNAVDVLSVTVPGSGDTTDGVDNTGSSTTT
jgi:flagellar basal-body rod modification protein FlgD